MGLIKIKIPFNKPSLIQNELKYINDTFTSAHISGNGKYTKQSENFLSNFHKKDALLTTSCTHSLEMCAKLLNLTEKDEIIVPSFTFVSTANAFRQNGSKIVFADIKLDDMNIDIESVEKLITKNTKAICIVHYAGAGASPLEFKKLCDTYDIALIEDNAHGLGGKYNGQLLGTFGKFATLSFHETKNIICGEGGATIFNDKEYFERAKILREKGTNRDKFQNGLVDKYTWVDDGSSWIMSDILASVLYGQLEMFDQIQTRRAQIWNSYKDELTSWALSGNVQIPEYPDHVEHTSHLFFLRFHSKEARNNFISHMREKGIQTPFHYQALHESPFAQKFGPSKCPNSNVASDTLVRLPIYFSLADEELRYVIDKIKEY